MSKVDSLARPPNRPKRTTSLQLILRRCCHYDIQSVYGLIKAFGGFDAMASDYHSTGWSLRVFARACAMGLTVNPGVFGFADDDEAGHALARLMHDARLQREGGDNE